MSPKTCKSYCFNTYANLFCYCINSMACLPKMTDETQVESFSAAYIVLKDSKGMDNIARCRNPFKVVKKVITSVAVLVITHLSRLALPYKSIYDQMMDKICLFMSITIQDNSWISCDWIRCQQSSFVKSWEKFVRPSLALIASAINRANSPMAGYFVQTGISLNRLPLFHRNNKLCTLISSHADTSLLGMVVVSLGSMYYHAAEVLLYGDILP